MSATPTGLAEENGHLPPVQSMCGTSVEVAWLPIAFSADVRMSVEQALRTRRTKLPKGRGVYHCVLPITWTWMFRPGGPQINTPSNPVYSVFYVFIFLLCILYS